MKLFKPFVPNIRKFAVPLFPYAHQFNYKLSNRWQKFDKKQGLLLKFLLVSKCCMLPKLFIHVEVRLCDLGQSVRAQVCVS